MLAILILEAIKEGISVTFKHESTGNHILRLEYIHPGSLMRYSQEDRFSDKDIALSWDSKEYFINNRLREQINIFREAINRMEATKNHVQYNREYVGYNLGAIKGDIKV